MSEIWTKLTELKTSRNLGNSFLALIEATCPLSKKKNTSVTAHCFQKHKLISKGVSWMGLHNGKKKVPRPMKRKKEKSPHGPLAGWSWLAKMMLGNSPYPLEGAHHIPHKQTQATYPQYQTPPRRAQKRDKIDDVRGTLSTLRSAPESSSVFLLDSWYTVCVCELGRMNVWASKAQCWYWCVRGWGQI